MKELDILLTRFVEENAQDLESGCWLEFESLLCFEDDILWDCLQDPGCEQAAPHRQLLTVIRDGHA